MTSCRKLTRSAANGLLLPAKASTSHATTRKFADRKGMVNQRGGMSGEFAGRTTGPLVI
jgi:hypothetical protein